MNHEQPEQASRAHPTTRQGTGESLVRCSVKSALRESDSEEVWRRKALALSFSEQSTVGSEQLSSPSRNFQRGACQRDSQGHERPPWSVPRSPAESNDLSSNSNCGYNTGLEKDTTRIDDRDFATPTAPNPAAPAVSVEKISCDVMARITAR